MTLWTRKLPQHLNCLWPRVSVKHHCLPELFYQVVIVTLLQDIRDLQPAILCCFCFVLQVAQCGGGWLLALCNGCCWSYLLQCFVDIFCIAWSLPVFTFLDIKKNIRFILGYWHQRTDKRLVNPLQGNREPLIVKPRMEYPRWLGWACPWNVINFSLKCSDTVDWATERASGL